MGVLNASGGRPRKGDTPYPKNGRVYWVRATEEIEHILEQARAADPAITSSSEHIRRLIVDGARWGGENAEV